MHYPTRPVDKDKAEGELVVNIKKATNPDETAPKQKHVRSMSAYFSSETRCTETVPPECIVYTWDYHSSISFWTGLRVQPILSDEVQTFKALITVHKVLQEGHPVVCYIVVHAAPLNNGMLVDHQRGTWTDGVVGDLRTDNRS